MEIVPEGDSNGSAAMSATTELWGLTAAAFAVLALGLAFSWLYSTQSDLQLAPSVLSMAAMVGLASLLVGALLGFLFGVPKARQESRPDGAEGYRGNTNLEQISDWLTKILVGVGLIQIGQVSGQLQRLSDYLSPSLGGKSSSPAFALVLLLYFSIAGFLISFLATRLLLGRAFLLADLGGIVSKQLAQREGKDSRALDLVNRQLDLNAPPVDELELNRAVAEASDSARQLILAQAQDTRRTGWQSGTNVAQERTIPVFRALIAADPKDHRPHGQLGYALKGKEPPEWAAAEAELTKAINLRGDWRTEGWILYEFNRALCRIHQDADFLDNRPSKPTQVEMIKKDLAAAAANDWVFSMMLADDQSKTDSRQDTAIAQWMRLNRIRPDELRAARVVAENKV